MDFDLVHDSQAVHRALVRAFSFPGRVVDLSGPFGRATSVHHDLPVSVVAVALTLLDAETSFFAPEPQRFVELTSARQQAIEDAQFVFLPRWEEAAASNSVSRLRRGTLSDPQEGATLVTYSEILESTSPWWASGPGFERPHDLALPGKGEFIAARNHACREFPLGFDWLWLRSDSTVVALPRTTRLVPHGMGV